MMIKYRGQLYKKVDAKWLDKPSSMNSIDSARRLKEAKDKLVHISSCLPSYDEADSEDLKQYPEIRNLQKLESNAQKAIFAAIHNIELAEKACSSFEVAVQRFERKEGFR